MFTLFPIALLVSHAFPSYSLVLLFVAFMIRGFKEFGDTSRKALIIGYCDPARCGQMVGAYYLVRDLIVSVAALVVAYLWILVPGLNFLGAASLAAAETIFYIRTLRQDRNRSLTHF